MTATSALAFDAWFAAARTIAISSSTRIRTAATENMVVFEAPDPVATRDLSAALARMVDSYRENVRASRKSGLVYVWIDEMSGTLRCSFCETTKFEELPFGRALVRASSLDAIALAVSEPLSRVIPYEALSDASSTDTTEPTPPPLPVFATLAGA